MVFRVFILGTVRDSDLSSSTGDFKVYTASLETKLRYELTFAISNEECGGNRTDKNLRVGAIINKDLLAGIIGSDRRY